MGRRAGSRNADFAATRARLLEQIGQRLAQADGVGASMHDLAQAAGVSTATLRHYFGDRDAVIVAYLEDCLIQGARYVAMVATEPLHPTVAQSLGWALGLICRGLEHSPLGKIHAFGLRAGLESPLLGPSYLRNLLEPTLRCVEARIERHQGRGDLPGRDPRLLALQLVSPLLLAVLHQRSLFGCQLRPLDLDALLADILGQLRDGDGGAHSQSDR
jgi:AcrR family transcriptional regulator